MCILSFLQPYWWCFNITCYRFCSIWQTVFKNNIWSLTRSLYTVHKIYITVLLFSSPASHHGSLTRTGHVAGTMPSWPGGHLPTSAWSTSSCPSLGLEPCTCPVGRRYVLSQIKINKLNKITLLIMHCVCRQVGRLSMFIMWSKRDAEYIYLMWHDGFDLQIKRR